MGRQPFAGCARKGVRKDGTDFEIPRSAMATLGKLQQQISTRWLSDDSHLVPVRMNFIQPLFSSFL